MVNLFLFNFYISDSNHIASDGTYKLIYQGFPILMIGTTDFNREYHPYGIMVTKHENEEDYEYLQILQVQAYDLYLLLIKSL